MYDYVGLCKAMESNVCHILTNEEPLYDAYTTYLPIRWAEMRQRRRDPRWDRRRVRMVISVRRLAHKIELRSTGVDQVSRHLCITGVTMFRRTNAKRQKKKKLVLNVFTTYLEDRRGRRETTYIYTEPWNDSLYEDQYSVPLPPIQVTRNKAITYSYTIWDSVSLDTEFLATAVKNLWVVLSFNASTT